MNLEQYTQLLGHQDPNQRKKAIIALGKSGDKRALQPLARVYKTDPDPELRQLALKAGRNIQKSAPAESVPEPDSSYSFTFNEPASQSSYSSSYGSTSFSSSSFADETPDWMKSAAAPPPPKPKMVSATDKSRAKGSLDRAIDMSMKADWEAVIFHLNEAIERDPGMEQNGTLIGLAVQATRVDSSRAIDELKRLKAEGKAKKPKAKRAASSPGEASAGDFFLEWPIWFIIMGLVFSTAAYGVIKYATNLLDEDFTATSDTGETIRFDENGNLVTTSAEGETITSDLNLEEIEEFVSEYGPITSLALGFVFSLSFMVTMTIGNYITWFVGGFMGGSGALFNFLVGTMRVDALSSLVTGGLYAALVVASASASSEPTTTNFENLSALQCIVALVGLVFFGVKCWMVGQKHEFGIGMGIANVIVGSIATTIVFACCWCGMLSALGGASSGATFATPVP